MGNIDLIFNSPRKSSTYYLYAIPGFLTGMARVIDLGGTFDSYNVSKDEDSADRQALLNDWKAIGVDLKSVVENAQK